MEDSDDKVPKRSSPSNKVLTRHLKTNKRRKRKVERYRKSLQSKRDASR